MDERMEKARAAIEGTSLPIGDVIRSVGYENESYFHREFKERYGVTPLTMRKKATVEIKRGVPT